MVNIMAYERAYENYRLTSEENKVAVSFEIWCKERASRSPLFQYWEIVMEMESCILTFLRSLRERNFDMYLDALTEFVPWFPMFHALTGCDTVSAFTSHGKRTAWITWNSFPELTEALLSLSFTPHSIPEETMKTIERFVILMYDKTSPCTDIDKSKKKDVFKATNSWADSSNIWCFGTTFKKSNLPRWLCMGTSSPHAASFTFTNRMGMDQRWQWSVCT